MKPHYAVISLLFLILSTPLVKAQDSLSLPPAQEISFRLHLQPLASYRFISNYKQSTSVEVLGTPVVRYLETTAQYRFEVEQHPGNAIKVKATIERIAFHIQAQEDSLSMDPSIDEQAQRSSTDQVGELPSLIDQSFFIFFNPEGKIVKVEGLPEAARPSELDDYPAFQEALTPQHFITEIEKAFNFYPEDAVIMGESWTRTQPLKLNQQIDLQIDEKFTLEGLSEDLAWINIDHQVTHSSTSPLADPLSIKGTQQGTIEMDLKSGFILFSECKQLLEGFTQNDGISTPLKISSTRTFHGEKL